MIKKLEFFSVMMLGSVLVCNAQLVDPQSPNNVKPDLNYNALPAVSQAANWDLVFSDEFNDTEMDPEKWNIQDNFSRVRDNDVLLEARTEDVEERDGNAYIYYTKDQTIEKTYYAGRFESKYKYARTFGYFEARMHIVESFGHQSAFWMMPNQEGTTTPNGVVDGTAKDGAEIDIIEGNFTYDKYSTGLHWDGYGADHQGKAFKTEAPGLYDQEYHTYGFEWAPTFIKWYYDGKLVRTETNPKFIALVDHHLYFTGSVFGESSNWVKKYIGDYPLLNNGGRDEMYVDYVRVYANKTLEVPVPNDTVIMDSEDNEGIAITGDWSTSTWTNTFYGTNYMHDKNSDSPKTVSYAPELGAIGDFEIFTRFPSGSNRSTKTKYEIVTKVNGLKVIETVLVDQTKNSGEWISIGTYTLSGVTGPKVIISNENADGYVIADAVSFVRKELPNNAVIMDNSDNNGIAITGDWATSTWTNTFYGTNYIHDKNSDNPKTVSYAPELGTIGNYEIFTRFSAGSNRSTKTKYEIVTKVNGLKVIETVLVDQTKNSGEWISLGTYTLSGVTFPKVIISNENANGYVIADAVAFAPRTSSNVNSTALQAAILEVDDASTNIFYENEELMVEFNQESSAAARINIYDLAGILVKTYTNIDISTKGNSVSIEPNASKTSSIYIVQTVIAGETDSKKVVW